MCVINILCLSMKKMLHTGILIVGECPCLLFSGHEQCRYTSLQPIHCMPLFVYRKWPRGGHYPCFEILYISLQHLMRFSTYNLPQFPLATTPCHCWTSFIWLPNMWGGGINYLQWCGIKLKYAIVKHMLLFATRLQWWSVNISSSCMTAPS